MHWDVVEVKPETDYRLFVRFKDGLSGHVQLRRETLTGVLAPLLDAQFFGQVFIDEGAVAWPGEIDLAPDAMYAEVSFRNQLPRLYELKDLLTDPSHPDSYFRSLEDESCLSAYAPWEQQLKALEPKGWEVLKSKASPYLQRRDKKRRGQLFDALGEAIAFNYLKESVGCSSVRFIPESDNPTPDLEGFTDGARVLCEVKTINISDAEIGARQGPPVARDITGRLTEEFLCKLDKTVANAKSQLRSFDPTGDAQHLAYVIICPDDWVPDHWNDYLKQIEGHLRNHPPGIKVVANLGPCTPWGRVVTFIPGQ